MAKKITLQQNDNGIKLLFTIKKDGAVPDISDSIVRVKFKNPTTETEFWKEAKIVDAENGQAQCILFRKDLTEIGSFQTEVETTFPNGLRITDKNPFIPIINEEIFTITQEVEKDFPSYSDENFD